MPNATPAPLREMTCEICRATYKARISRKGKCHSCRRFMTQYGLSRPEYETMRAVYRRDGCAICQDRTARPVVDHQHGTKRARGMLCDRCNRGLGVFRDSADILAAAARYVTRGDWRLGTPTLAPATAEDAARTLHCDGHAHSNAMVR